MELVVAQPAYRQKPGRAIGLFGQGQPYEQGNKGEAHNVEAADPVQLQKGIAPQVLDQHGASEQHDGPGQRPADPRRVGPPV